MIIYYYMFNSFLETGLLCLIFSLLRKSSKEAAFVVEAALDASVEAELFLALLLFSDCVVIPVAAAASNLCRFFSLITSISCALSACFK